MSPTPRAPGLAEAPLVRLPAPCCLLAMCKCRSSSRRKSPRPSQMEEETL